MTEKHLTILHFNDAYHIFEVQHEPVGGAARFNTAIKRCKDDNPLVLFGGDLFNPSLLSTVTKGKHMCPLMNAFGVRNAVVGNHDFDFGLDELTKLVDATKTTWLLTNVTNKNGEQLCHTKPYDLFEWNGVTVGLIGLVEQEWLTTLTIDTTNLKYESAIECGRKMALDLKAKGAEIVIALTHMRLPNDEILAQNTPEIDLILGGHDHFDVLEEVNGITIAKNGNDFHYLTRLEVTIPANRDQRVKVTGKRIEISKEIEPDKETETIVKEYDIMMRGSMEKVVAISEVVLDARSITCRTQESNLGSYLADIMVDEMDADISILNSGTIRSDLTYGPGKITIGTLLQILPFEDIIVVIEVTGAQIVAALENAVSQYPKQEGRFPQVSSHLRFTFDPARQPQERITAVSYKDPATKQFAPIDLQRKFKVATKSYLTEGKDGFTSFASPTFVVDEENGLLLSTMVRRHWLKEKVCNTLRSPHNTLAKAVDKFKTHNHSHLPILKPQVQGRITKL